jgi:hypothetical protein
VLVVIEIPGGSSELDHAITETWNVTSNPPPGNILRLAGPMDNGWRVVSLWDSVEQFRHFLEDQLHLALDDDDAAEQPKVTYWEVETINRFD